MKYKDAGVDVEKADSLVSKVELLASKTMKNGIISGIGGYAGSFKVEGFKKPVFSATTDGVGTKLKIAFMTGIHNTVGVDLVAMCVNDLITNGSEPLIFLDYFACGKLEENIYLSVLEGIVNGCKEAECALIGGETAEMPGFYKDGEYELAGFCVGVCEEDDLIVPKPQPGDIVIALKSSGLHSNGYSLVRKIVFDLKGLSPDVYVPELERSLGEELLVPTRIYVKEVKLLKRKIRFKGIAHITGGGLLNKPKRILSSDVSMVIYKDAWEPQPIFRLLQKWGGVPEEEMFSTFNMGLGMLLVVGKDDVEEVLEVVEEAVVVGEIIKGNGEVMLWEGRF